MVLGRIGPLVLRFFGGYVSKDSLVRGPILYSPPPLPLPLYHSGAFPSTPFYSLPSRESNIQKLSKVEQTIPSTRERSENVLHFSLPRRKSQVGETGPKLPPRYLSTTIEIKSAEERQEFRL